MRNSYKEDEINLNERVEDYLLEANRLANKYRKDPKVKHKEIVDAMLYWGTMLVFCLFLTPLSILFLIWFNFIESFSFFSFLFSPTAQMIWALISVIGVPLSIIFRPKPERYAWNMAINEIDDKSVPFRHREI